ncbi:type II toxin-antitoxin system RelE/ParE family toxin [Scopulibacillus cellulosilyticus]|uniref:Type II toxin-antitoxin system RelE/ParE family toxin n=1 Tax=Scopulibacillus cellulosilyticus TaxID=2665665 RepID=A0ABW2PPV4_9BACL
MVKIVWSPDSVIDLEEISEFIGQESDKYASNIVIQIIKLAEVIASFPLSGRIVPEINNMNVPEKLYKNYRIIYRISNDHRVDILRIYHQSQRLKNNVD